MVTALEKQFFMIKQWYFYVSVTLLVGLFGSSFTNVEENHDWFYVSEHETNYHDVKTKVDFEMNLVNVPHTGKSFAGFKQALAFKESQGKYNKVNELGYMGKYQFGMETMKSIGVKDSLQFMTNPKLQERAFKALLSKNKWELRNELDQFVGKEINGVLITESGVLAAAHLGGVGSVKRFFKSNGNRVKKDAFGTSILSYMKKFGGYDTRFIPAKSNSKVKKAK